MTECMECCEYVSLLLSRGDITKQEAHQVTSDRHALNYCTKKSYQFKEWLKFAIENQAQIKIEREEIGCYPQWNKGYFEALQDVMVRYTMNNND